MDQPGSSTENQQPLSVVTVIDSDKADIEQNKDIAAFSYLWIMSVIVYLLKRKSPFVRFHAKQAMVLFVLSIVVWLIPVVNGILELGVLALMVIGFLHAAQGERKDVPIIGPLSRGEISMRQAWKQLVDMVAHAWKSVRGNGKKSSPEPPSSNPPTA